MPSPASGSCSTRPNQSRLPSRAALLDERIQQQIRDVVGQRPADQELHRQIVDALGVLPVVGALGLDPALRKHVAHRAGDGLEALSRLGGSERVDHVVEQQMALEQRIGSPGKRNGAEIVECRRLRLRVDARSLVHDALLHRLFGFCFARR